MEGSPTVDGLRVGLFGIGLDAYWPQFAGLKERWKATCRVASKLQRPGVEIMNLGLIDTPRRRRQAGHRFRQADVDLIFLTSRPTRFRPRCCRWCGAPRCR